MNADLKRTCLDHYPTFLVSEAGLRAASELSFALLWRSVGEGEVMRILSRQSECNQEFDPEGSKLADPSQNKLRMTSLGGPRYIRTTPAKNQIATQKRLAMTALMIDHCPEPLRRSKLTFIVESCHSEHSEESSRSKSAGGPRCTRTAPITANLISKIKFWGTGTTSTKNQIAAQKRLAMTELMIGHCEEYSRRSNLTFIAESCHSEHSEESSRSKFAGWIRFARTAPTKNQIAAQKKLEMTELCGIRFARTTSMQALLWKKVRATGLIGVLSCLDEKHQQLSNPPLQACG